MPLNPSTSTRVLVLVLGLATLGGCAAGVAAPHPPTQPPTPTLSACVRPSGGGAFATDLARLRSPDFIVRQQAAERLVRVGEGALDALGALGDQKVRGLGDVEVSTTQPVVAAILGELSPDRVRVHLDGTWPVVRRAAADELGERGVMGAVPCLITRLDDGDEGVRRAAVASLRRLTQRYFGYVPTGTLVARREARARWGNWWQVEGRRRAERDTGFSG